jgi:glycerophosphoryl diester phosphodiesterase
MKNPFCTWPTGEPPTWPRKTRWHLLQLAWELGADAAECDVMLSSDHEVVLFHDKNTKKLTGENYKVSETSWQVLSNLEIQLRETNLKEYQGETIPRLAEVLATIPENRMLVIEIKTGPEILPFLQEVVIGVLEIRKISLIAFDFETIRRPKSYFRMCPVTTFPPSGPM